MKRKTGHCRLLGEEALHLKVVSKTALALSTAYFLCITFSGGTESGEFQLL